MSVARGTGEATGIPARLRQAMADRYPLERALGRGGMATVYLARDPKHQRSVAVKVLHPELAAGLGAERFLREIRIEAGLQHPHILPLHDSGEADGFLYFVMPYVPGESLRQRLVREGPLPIEDALRIAGEVADALSHAHEHGVVHRDIKPENILLSGGHALVADFGIAKAVETAGDQRLTETGWGMGTPAYMSPEQIVGAAVDGRSDLYGLGCVLYEMLAGQPPFPADNARAVFARHQLDLPPALRATRPEVPAVVDEAVRIALAKLPAERFATAGQFLESLRGTPAAGPARSVPLLSAERTHRRSTRTLAALAAAGVLAVGGYLVAFRAGSWGLRAGRATSVAVVPIENLEGDTNQAYVAEGMTDELITNLARIHGLRVINRRTMMAYGKGEKTPVQIASELGVDAVVTGALQRLGDTVHLTAQLTLAGQHQALWAGTYDGTRGDLLRLQGEVARAVGGQLRGKLTSADRAGLASTKAADPAVLDRYVRGRYWWNKRGQPNLMKAIAAFNEALDRDPTFAQAYSALGDSYVQLGYGSFLAPDDAFPKARAAAEKALALDSALAEPHATLGFVHMYFDWDWPAAEREFRAAIGRNPSYATAHEWYGLFLAAMGRFDEAQAEERRAEDLDPLSVAVASTAGWVLDYSGKQPEAERRLRIALRSDSTFAIAHLYLGRVLQFEGSLDSALAHFAAMGQLRSWIPNIAGEGYVYAQEGRRQEALAALARMDSLSRTQYVTPYAMALVHTALGDRDSAFVWLERSVQGRTHWVVWLNRDLRWKPIRADPRFVALVKQVGLPS
jgi:TolB-like protein/Tfp pilus assembly protein PilF/tRNA A-37 threonylcarbamoyl transferase component Bud32